MTGKGVKPTQLFMVDGNTSDYSKDFQAGTMKGAQGTIPPGTFAKDAFKQKLLAIDPALKDYSYAGESYDAVNLIALASEAAKSTKARTSRPSSRKSLKAARSAPTSRHASPCSARARTLTTTASPVR